MEEMQSGDDDWDGLIRSVIGALIEVHKRLGPGFLENVYGKAVEIELRARDIPFESEKKVELTYRDESVGTHRLDLLVAGHLVVELKTVEQLGKKHYAQVRSYLKAVEQPVGLLVNFADFTLDVRRVEPVF